jgi:NADH-ubiquinone oxidoreductase chain 1
MRIGIYFLLFCCWGSNSKYSLIGGYRAISQTVSYEVSLIFFVLFFVYLTSSYDLYLYDLFQRGLPLFLVSVAFFFSWFFVCLSERNRTPFDFSEGESELVSGFNIEYGGGLFSLIFICEYGIIIFLSFLSVTLFWGSTAYFLSLTFFCFLFVVVRCCYPRFRYDFLMDSA